MHAFRTPKDHDASYSTETNCSSISGPSVSLLAWKRVFVPALFTKGCSPRVAPCSVSFAGYHKVA
jgi:hypothetical protein